MSYKQTKKWIVDKERIEIKNDRSIKEAALWIKKGGVVAFPTETVYGLGASAVNPQAVKKIFEAKGRPSDNPLIVHIATREQLDQLVSHVSYKAEALIKAFWPGALTLIVKNEGAVAENVTAGLSTVAVRMPNHYLALALIEEAGVPLAAPSANLSGRPSPTTAQHVLEDLNGRIAGILDGGETGVGIESTVLDVSTDEPILYRPGGVTKEQIEAVIGPITIDPVLSGAKEVARSPGMKYTHYAPNGQLIIVQEQAKIQSYVNRAQQEGHKVGILTTVESQASYRADTVIACGRRSDLESVAKQLYQSLRQFDERGIEVIYAETFPVEGVGVAIMNRLEKAAGGRIV